MVELLPVHQFDPHDKNYWGYMTLNFFAPHAGYAADCAKSREEFRAMVRALHEAGIEVILDVVYNHTAEGDHTGPTYSFRGIDNRLLLRDVRRSPALSTVITPAAATHSLAPVFAPGR